MNHYLRENVSLISIGVGGVLVGAIVAGILFSIFQTRIEQAPVPSLFIYSFKVDGILEEAGSPRQTSSPYFWLNSGGKMIIESGIGKTVEGELSSTDRWFKAYKKSSNEDTDQGTHPQNLFRLLTRSTWGDVRVESDFYIAGDNFSGSPNRNASNGLLFMARYKDGDHLYYAGVRVDGTAIIKKKYGGIYYTMHQEKIFPDTYQGMRDDKNLLPHTEWLRLRMDINTLPGGSVVIRLYIKKESEDWVEIANTTDEWQYSGTPPIDSEGPVGIRTDFMDVRFRDFRVEQL